MLVYRKLLNLMSTRGITKSKLREYGFSPNLIYKLERGEQMNTINIDKLCALLNCQPGDIMEYVPDQPQADQPDQPQNNP